jgi:VIT1/CCC1 family predicted Fe2+/Mn2+ transporter
VTDDINIRLVKVEQRLDSLCRELNDEREETRRKSDRIFLALDELKKNADSNKGFFGGIVFATGAIFAVIAYVFGKGG